MAIVVQLRETWDGLDQHGTLLLEPMGPMEASNRLQILQMVPDIPDVVQEMGEQGAFIELKEK